MIDQKIHIKVKTKSQSECKDSADGFKLDNAHVCNVQPMNSPSDLSMCYFCFKCCRQSDDLLTLLFHVLTFL
jgi:hypothetical protein